MKPDVLTVIYQLQVDIFSGRFEALPENFALLSEGLASVGPTIPGRHIAYYREILLAMLESYESGDLLRFADVLEFELKPLLVGLQDGAGQHEHP